MMNRIFKKSNWMVLFPAGILFFLLAANPLFADYSGQVASFKNEDNAAIFADKMKAKGLEAFYQKENVPGKGEFYRSYIGRYKTSKLARKALSKLKKTGVIDFFQIQKIAEKKVETAAKEKDIEAQKNEPTRKPENTTEPSIQESENKTEPEIQKPEDNTAPPVQKLENKTATPINTKHYYDGVKGIVLKNGRVVKGRIISIDHNDVLKIRTKRGKILSYSFMKDVKEYITE